MYDFQRKRLFPLPDYNITANRVEVVIIGKILDMDYANLLARKTDLSLTDIELLNRLQLGKPLTSKEVDRLRKLNLVEGRKPNLYIAKGLAKRIGQNIDYSKHKGLADKACEELLLKSLKDHGKLTKPEITALLWNVLPDVLTDQQKTDKIKNMLTRLRKLSLIENVSKGPKSEWLLRS